MIIPVLIICLCSGALAGLVVGGIWHDAAPDTNEFDHINIEDLN